MNETVSEEQLTKALDELESSVSKSDALHAQDPEGGFATEGEALSEKVIKALVDAGLSLAKAKKVAAKAMEAEEEEGEEEEGEEGCAKAGMVEYAGTKKAETIEYAATAKGVKKSIDASAASLAKAVAADAAQLQKALADNTASDASGSVDVTEFVSGLIDSTTRATDSMEKSISALTKSLSDSEERTNGMNVRFAKALRVISNEVRGMDAKIEALSNQPVMPNNAVTLQKSDIVNPVFQGGVPSVAEVGPAQSPLQQVPILKVQEALFKKAIAGQVDPMLVTKFESEKNFSILPPTLIKSLEQELCHTAEGN